MRYVRSRDIRRAHLTTGMGAKPPMPVGTSGSVAHIPLDFLAPARIGAGTHRGLRPTQRIPARSGLRVVGAPHGAPLRDGDHPMPATKTLSTAQMLVLAAAAQRHDHAILPLPPTVRARGGAQRSLLASLLRMDLIKEFPIGTDAEAWRTEDASQAPSLRLTAAGLAAVGSPDLVATVPAEDAEAADVGLGAGAGAGSVGALPACPEPAPSADETPASVPPARSPGGKLGQVLQAVSTPPGATLTEITSLTGWLPHTARAAVTGLRQRGHAIGLVERDGRKAYRLVEADR